jgi:DHA2 family multidrug resistance protein
VAVIATLVQSRTTFHYAHLAQQVTASSPLGQLIPAFQALFTQHGASLSAAYSAALQEISGLIRLQASVLAIRDAFLVSLVLTFGAIISAFFVRSRRKTLPEDARPLNEQEQHEANAAREEAGLAL